MDSSLAVWSGEEAFATGLKPIPDTYAPCPTPGSLLCARSSHRWCSFPCNLSKCVLICHCLYLLLVQVASPSGCDNLLLDMLFFYLSSKPTLLHMHKMNNQHFEEPFFAPKMSLLQVYFSLPIKQMLPALRGIFCVSQSLSLGGLPDARVLGRAVHGCLGGKMICFSNRRGNQSVAEHGRTGGGCCIKMEKCKQV